MDKSLIEDIEKTISREKMQCNFIADDQAVQLIQTLAAKFSFDTNQLFIWADNDAGKIYDYEDDLDKWDILMKSLLDQFEEELFVAITDEDYSPWKVLKCKKHFFIKLLEEQRYFEYFLFDTSMNCVVFDTHDNSLVVFKVIYS